MKPIRGREDANQRLRNQLEQATRRLKFTDPAGPTIGTLRRGYRPPEDTFGLLTLTEVNGVLLWQDGPVFSPLAPQRRAGRFLPGLAGDIIFQKPYQKLEPNKIGAHLTELDNELTQTRGLRQYAAGKLSPPRAKAGAASRRILLFIHGTFSNSTNLYNELQATTAGGKFLADAEKAYDKVLFFDHYTVSMSPVMNALDLARLFADCGADVDVICHSRGGLVTRWWLEVLDRRDRKQVRAIFVGSPHDGTSLAAPDKIRAGMSLLTNLARAAEMVTAAASTLVPFLTVATGLMRFLSSAGSVAANTPLVDAAVAMVPGVAAMSKITNNEELNRLNQDGPKSNLEYYAVQSNFEPVDKESEAWKFWKYFTKQGAADLAADLLIFPGPNDLVVDTASMTAFPPSRAPKAICDFGTTPTVHHTNYFRQAKTLQFFRDALAI